MSSREVSRSRASAWLALDQGTTLLGAATRGAVSGRVIGKSLQSPHTTPADHHVHFYEDDARLAVAVARFLADGIRAGDAILVIATRDHWELIGGELEASGFDLAELRKGRLTILDAHETLAKFMRATGPDPALFESSVGQSVASVTGAQGNRRLRAYGEMVDLLWRDGERCAAIRLEELWNDLKQRLPFTLFCAYAMGNFYREPADLERVLAAHSHATLAEDPPGTLGPSYAVRLAREITHRKEVERALRDSLGELRAKEDALRQSEEQLRDFVENATVGLHRVSPEGTILWANRAELELLGYTEAEYVGRSVADFHADPEDAQDLLTRLGRGEEIRDHAARLRARDGSIKHVLISANVYSRDGQFIHTRCFTRDVTERREAEEKLRHSQGKHAARAERLIEVTGALASAVSSAEVFEALVDGVAGAIGASTAALWLVDEDGRTARLARSRGYAESTRQELAELRIDAGPGLPVLDSIRRGEPVWIESQEAMLEQYPHLAAFVTAGRSYRVSCLPLVSNGRVLGALGLTMEQGLDAAEEERDFLLLIALYASQAVERLRLFEAERRSREEALEAGSRAEQLYRFAQTVVGANRVEVVFDSALAAIEAALNAERAAILTFDPEGVMRFRAWRNLSEPYRSAVEGHSPWSADAVAPEPVLVPEPERDPAMASFLPLFRAEGIGALAFIPLVSRGRLLGKFMVYYDRPHRFAAHEVETATAIANHLASVISRFAAVESLQDTIRSNELFAGALAHDLRNPLGAIMTAAQVALMQREGASPPGDRDARPLSRILSSGRRMASMIDQLLDFTRARSGGGIEVDPRETDLGDLCRQAVEELELTHAEWKIDQQVVGDLTGTWDSDRLLQVISNLVANAGQHGEANAPISVRLDGTDRDRARIAVHNRGAIPDSLLPNLFDPFRGTRYQQNQSRGLGLGLFIVREIVRAHGGIVNVRSSAAAGTTFEIELPRVSPRRRPHGEGREAGSTV